MNWLQSNLFEPAEVATAPAAPAATTPTTTPAPTATPAAPGTVLGAAPAAAPVTPPAPASITDLIVDGKFQAGFSARLTDDLKPYGGTLRKFEGVPVADVLKSYGELEKKIGQRVQAPGEGAKPEEIAAWRKITGAPETADGYKIEKPADMPPELWSPDLAKGFSEIAHKHSLPPSAVAEIATWWNGQQSALYGQAMGQVEAETAKQIEGLRTEWGEKFAPNVQAASRIAKIAGVDVEDPDIGNNPAVIKALHAVSLLVSEDKQPVGGVGGGPVLSYAQQADDIQTNKSNPLYDDYHGKNGEQRQRQAAERARALRAAGNR